MISSGFTRLASHLTREIDEMLLPMGLMYRIFSRAKDNDSAKKKIHDKQYHLEGKKLQDIVGIRVTAYFHEDLCLIEKVLKDNYLLNNQTIDKPEEEVFSPERMNLVFNFTGNHLKEFEVSNSNELVDATFEIQLRTVLSEGWHEVEHDLRYKCKDSWDDHQDLSRILNGVWANLSNCDWALNNLFNEMSYRNYKGKKWSDMIRNKFKIRINGINISSALNEYMCENLDFSKKIFRINRERFISDIYRKKISVPITYDNIIFLCNLMHINNDDILALTPNAIKEQFKWE